MRPLSYSEKLLEGKLRELRKPRMRSNLVSQAFVICKLSTGDNLMHGRCTTSSSRLYAVGSNSY